MTHPRPPFDSLLLDRQVDAICDRFESELLRGAAPSLAEFLPGEDLLRTAVLYELARMELEYRQRRGECVGPDEYLARFPELAADPRAASWVSPPASNDPVPPTTVETSAATSGRAELPALSGYEILGELGRGGMGVVYRARDKGLDRPVALKALHEDFRDRTDLTQRFLDEARVAGQLQHPGVPPVHEVGTLPDGRPYFVMKVVAGRTLQELLAARPRAGENLPHFLGVFEQVCQAMAYAHAQGVIHRDLKPANIMVGAFGEVQVMDWGLAKRMKASSKEEGGRTKDEAGSCFDSSFLLPPSSFEETLEGTVLGTPAFMPPEQARGELSRLDRRADVFSLGAILCVILTGKPPYLGARDEMLDLARVGDLDPARLRLANGGLDADLVRLATACLREDPADRPADAGAVAAAMTTYQSQLQARMRKAEVDRAAAEARAEEESRTRQVAEAKARVERRARRLVVGLSAASLLLLVTAGGGTWLLRQRGKATDAGVLGLMTEARQLLRQARDNPLQEGGKFEQARARGRDARSLAESGRASAEFSMQARALLEELDQEAEAAERDRKLVAALLEVPGPWEGPKYEKTSQGTLSPLPRLGLDDLLRSAFHDWGLEVDRTPVQEMVARVNERPRDIVLEIVGGLDRWAAECRRLGARTRAERLLALAGALDEDPRRRELRALMANDSLVRERALAMLGMAFRPVPIPIDAGHGAARQRLQQLVDAADPRSEPILGISLLVRALRDIGNNARAETLLRETLRERPQIVSLYYVLASLLDPQGRRAEVIECYVAARALRPSLGVALARSLMAGGRVAEGRKHFERLLEEQKDSPYLHQLYGTALHERRLRAEAERAFERATALQPDFAQAWYNLGINRFAQQKWKASEVAFRQLIALRPEDDEAHIRLGDALVEQDLDQKAADAYREAARLNDRNATAHYNLGTTLLALNRTREAETSLRRALALNENDAEALLNLGNVLKNQGRLRDAEAAFRRAIEKKPTFAIAHNNLGNSLLDRGMLREAEQAFRSAVTHDPKYAKAWCNLGAALDRQNEWAKAEEAFRRALTLAPSSSTAHRNLGIVLLAQGKPIEAEIILRRGVKRHPRDPLAHMALAAAFQARGKFQAAADSLAEAIRLGPSDPEPRSSLGIVLCRQGKYAEGERAFQRALELQPGDSSDKYNLGLALLAQGKAAQAEGVLRESLRLRPGDADTRHQIGVAQMEQGKFGDALQTLRESPPKNGKRAKTAPAVAEAIATCERFLELTPRLAALVSGQQEIRNGAERLDVVRMCRLACHRRHATAARLWEEVFAEDPRRADDLALADRYNAAASAILAAAGRATDAANLPDKVRQRLRRLALEWLRADLTLRKKQVEHVDPAARQAALGALQFWQHDANLAPVRDGAELKRLPVWEREDWGRLWEEVAGLVGRMDPGPERK